MKNSARKIVLFDFDGVFVDAWQSFGLTMLETIRLYIKNDKVKIGAYKKKDIIKFIEMLKATGEFNSDIDTSTAIIMYLQNRKLFESKFHDFMKEIVSIRDNIIVMRKGGPKLIIPSYNRIIKMFQEVYFGELYGRTKSVKRTFYGGSGFYKREIPCIKRDIFKKIVAVAETGIVTGRTKKELDISVKNLGLSKYMSLAITTDDIPELNLRKPAYYPLWKALKILKCGKDDSVFYLGDEMADLMMVDAVRKKGFNVKFIACVWANKGRIDLFKRNKVGCMAYKPAEILRFINA